LTGAGPCGEAGRLWSRYAPTSELNGQFHCKETTGDAAALELARNAAGSSQLDCITVASVVRQLDAKAPLNICNATAQCPPHLSCTVPDAACGYCAPQPQPQRRPPCFEGGAIECGELTINAIAAGIGVATALLSVWTRRGEV